MNDLNEKTETEHMNGWEALSKIVSEIVFGAVFIAILGVIYLLCK